MGDKKPSKQRKTDTKDKGKGAGKTTLSRPISTALKHKDPTSITRIYLKDPSDLKRLLGNVIHQVRIRQLTPQQANAITYACNSLMKTFDLMEFHGMLSRLEERVFGVSPESIPYLGEPENDNATEEGDTENGHNVTDE